MASATPFGRRSPVWLLKILVRAGLLSIFVVRVDLARLWQTARTASSGWLAGAFGAYVAMKATGCWRWWLLLRAQHVRTSYGQLASSYVKAAFANNFLPSNIGGDVLRIRDTAQAAGSVTVATTVVLADRSAGMIALVFVAAVGATLVAHMGAAVGPIGPGLLWTAFGLSIGLTVPAVAVPQGVGTLLRPLRALRWTWLDERVDHLTGALQQFRRAPRALVTCFVVSIAVQALVVVFYAAIATALHLPIPLAQLAIVVPLANVAQLLPVSLNGLGVRDAAFVFYLSRQGLPLEGVLALSFIGAALIMAFSLGGAAAYLRR